MQNLTNLLYNKNPLIIFSYLSRNVYGDNTPTNIAKETNLAVSSVSQILKSFEEADIVQSHRIGKSIVYKINNLNPLVAPFKAFTNIAELNSLIQELKEVSQKGILFGSCATGEDDINSDIDLCIVTENEKEEIYKIIQKYETLRPINPVIMDTVELMNMENEDRVFYNQIMKGKVLWE